MKESTGREKNKQRHVRAEQNKKTLRQLGKFLAKANAERLRAILTTDTVTEFLENSLGVNVAPFILYQGKPYVYPYEVSKYFTTKDVMQRDIRIEVPCNKAGAIETVLFARSWIAINELDEEFRELLCAGKMTIGQIIRDRRPTIEYQNIGYKEVRSATLAAAFKTQGNVRLIRRSRMICNEKRPVILIHEFIPV
jgi:chorismate-pyruvate lyase